MIQPPPPPHRSTALINIAQEAGAEQALSAEADTAEAAAEKAAAAKASVENLVERFDIEAYSDFSAK